MMKHQRSNTDTIDASTPRCDLFWPCENIVMATDRGQKQDSLGCVFLAVLHRSVPCILILASCIIAIYSLFYKSLNIYTITVSSSWWHWHAYGWAKARWRWWWSISGATRRRANIDLLIKVNIIRIEVWNGWTANVCERDTWRDSWVVVCQWVVRMRSVFVIFYNFEMFKPLNI
jgi:hypothetical protein